jgi:hypothetical protein
MSTETQQHDNDEVGRREVSDVERLVSCDKCKEAELGLCFCSVHKNVGRGRAALVEPRKPRYDDVFHDGVKWLDGN